MKTQTQYLDISTTTILRALVLIGGAYFIYLIRDVLVLLVVAFIISSGITIASKFMKKRYQIPYTLGVSLILSIIVGILTLLLSLLLPIIFTEFQVLVQSTPRLITQLDQLMESIIGRPVGSIRDIIPQGGSLSNYIQTISSGFFFTTENVFARLLDMLFLITSTIILAYKPRLLDDLIVTFFPKHLNRKVRSSIKKARMKVGGWILGQMILSTIVGIGVYIVFVILQIPYALLLSLIVAALNMIPMIGAVLSMFPAVFFALFNSLQTAFIVIVFYTILQQLDGNILTPMVLHKVTGINAIVIIFSVLIGVTFAGALGALIAVPVVSVISIFVSELTYSKDQEPQSIESIKN